jgi:hypothetical protein
VPTEWEAEWAPGSGWTMWKTGNSLGEVTYEYVRYEGFTAATMKNAVFWDLTPRGSCKNRLFGEAFRLLHQGDNNR